MRFLIKEISTSRKEVRITLNPVNFLDVPHYIFGQVDGNFDEGSIGNRYIPTTLSKFTSAGPNAGVIRLIVAFLKDNFGMASDFDNSILVTKNGQHIPILNAVVDDINLIQLSSDTLPSMILKLLNPLPETSVQFDEVSIEKQIITTQEEEVYFVPSSIIPPDLKGLDYDVSMKEEVVAQPDKKKLEYESYNDLTGSFNLDDKNIISQIVSGSNQNINIDYSKFENHVHFGSAVSKLQNFKNKVGKIEGYFLEISKSLATTGSDSINKSREYLFKEINKEKNSFTPYEHALYYNAHEYGFNIGLGKNYIHNKPIKSFTNLNNTDGFDLIYKTSGSITSSNIQLFSDKYNVEDKPFYNDSGSFYLSFLMRGDETINGNIRYQNNQENYIPKLPKPTLYSSSILQPIIKSGSWGRYIYHASASYWAPHESNPVIGSPGGITNFTTTDEITILNGISKENTYAIRAGGRYSNLATTVTSSGASFTGSISPAGELFKIDINTNYNTAITSSYLTDIKISKFNPTDVLPFSNIHKTGSNVFESWYDNQIESASLYDQNNIHSFEKSTPSYLHSDNQMDNETFRKFVNLTGEHFDLIKNYIDDYLKIYKNTHIESEAPANNLLPVLANQKGWGFNIPFSRSGDNNLEEFFGSTINNINNNVDVRNNIWRNLLANINYMYRTKGTQNSIRALLNSYGFPPDILKLREHGASLDSFDNSVLSDDNNPNKDGLGATTGNVSFQTKVDKMVMYVIDSSDRKIGTEWRRDSVDADVIEFVFKPVKSTTTQTILQVSGSNTSSMWDIILEPNSSDNISSRLQFRLNNLKTGSGDITNTEHRISMSTDYYNFKNQNYWNVLLQRTSGPTGSNILTGDNLLTSHSYQLYVGESKQDKLRVLQAVSMSFGGTEYSQSAMNWIGTGSRDADTGNNLIIGGNYTGSVAEIKTWKQALSSSIFKQHIYDKKSAVGNSLEDSKTSLIYHYRLNENWGSGSSNPKIKDSNVKNLKDYSIDISNDTLGDTPLYDTDEIDRIQFNVRAGGSVEISDNNIIIDNPKRAIGNLDPKNPSFMSVYDPLINKRKASSVIEIVRSPQDVINDFILNQLGNFDFNDKFADPRDINKPFYDDLEDFSKDFFDYFDVSLDVNKYISAQAAIFNKDLIKSIKRLVPARATFSKIGIELKPTFLERPKIQSRTLEHSLIDIGPNNIKYHTIDPNDDTPISDWKNNVFLGKKVESILNETKDLDFFNFETDVDQTDSYFNFTNKFELFLNKEGHIPISSNSGSVLNLNVFELPPENAHIPIASNSGSVLNLTNELILNKDAHIPISSHSGSLLNLNVFELPPENAHIPIASNSGSVLNLTNELVLGKDAHIPISSHSGSVLNLNVFELPSKDSHIPIASNSGSVLNLTEELFLPKDSHIPIASNSGSVLNLTNELILSKDVGIPISSHSGSVLNLNMSESPPKNTRISVSSHSGSVLNLTEELFLPKNIHIPVSSHSGSVLNLTNELNLNKKGHIAISSATSSNPDMNLNIVNQHTFNFKTTVGNQNKTGSILMDLSEKVIHNLDFVVADATSSITDFDFNLITTKDADLHFSSNDNFYTKFNSSFIELSDVWGTGVNDTHFINPHFETGSEGKDGYYNTYHYEKRYIFHTIGDVETLSGSNPNVISSFETDYDGTITAGVFTASKDFSNQTFLQSDTGLGSRPLGMTIEFKASTASPPPYGKFLDNSLVYPKNHQFLIGTSKDNIDSLIYKGTQNSGGEIIESQEFTDLSTDSYYYVKTTGGSGYTIQYDS